MPVIDASEYTRKVLGSALVKDQVNRIVNGPRQNNLFAAVQFRSKLVNKVITTDNNTDGSGGGSGGGSVGSLYDPYAPISPPTAPYNFIFKNAVGSGAFRYFQINAGLPSVSTTFTATNGTVAGDSTFTIGPSSSFPSYELDFTGGPARDITLSGFHSSQDTLTIEASYIVSEIDIDTVDFRNTSFTNFILSNMDVHFGSFPSFPLSARKISITLNSGVTFPSTLRSLTNLNQIQLQGSSITSFPITTTEPFFPATLTNLNLNNNYLTSIPKLTTLTQLTELILNNNLISQANFESTIINLPTISSPQSLYILNQWHNTVSNPEFTPRKPWTIEIPPTITLPYRGWIFEIPSTSFFGFSVDIPTLTDYEIDTEFNAAFLSELWYSYNFAFNTPFSFTELDSFLADPSGTITVPTIKGKAYRTTGVTEQGAVRFEGINTNLKNLKIRDKTGGTGPGSNKMTSFTISSYFSNIVNIDLNDNNIDAIGLKNVLDNLPNRSTVASIKILSQSGTILPLPTGYSTPYRGWNITS